MSKKKTKTEFVVLVTFGSKRDSVFSSHHNSRDAEALRDYAIRMGFTDARIEVREKSSD